MKTDTTLDRLSAIAADVAAHNLRPLANEITDAVIELRNDGKDLWREHAKQADEECHTLRSLNVDLRTALAWLVDLVEAQGDPSMLEDADAEGWRKAVALAYPDRAKR